MNNGDGLRTVLWVSGCNHHCKECQNPITWNPDTGIEFTDADEKELFDSIQYSWISGITFSGGDPLHPVNRDKVGELAAKFKATYPNKTIWLYTGYILNLNNGFYFTDDKSDSFSLSWLKYVDILIDGKFDCDRRESDLQTGKYVPWRGSSNQRIIDVPASIKLNIIIEK